MDILDEKIIDFMIDISEENIRNSMLEILDILLIDRTTTTQKKSIILYGQMITIKNMVSNSMHQQNKLLLS